MTVCPSIWQSHSQQHMATKWKNNILTFKHNTFMSLVMIWKNTREQWSRVQQVAKAAGLTWEWWKLWVCCFEAHREWCLCHSLLLQHLDLQQYNTRHTFYNQNITRLKSYRLTLRMTKVNPRMWKQWLTWINYQSNSSLTLLWKE